MSTNYYVIIDECPYCGRGKEMIHIGKTSYGWPFTFHGYESQGIIDFESWKEFIKDKNIVDEYDRKITYNELLKTIEDSSKSSKNKRENDFLFCDFC